MIASSGRRTVVHGSIEAIVAANVPLVLPDTCILLDILRSPRRDTVDARAVACAKIILEALTQSGVAASVIAGQVIDELDDNRSNVGKDTEDGLQRLQTELDRINAWSAELGVAGQVDISHGMTAAARCADILDTWLAASVRLATTDELAGRAHRRLMQCRTPARRGKDSFKDCLVVETYLDIARVLRDGGHTAAIVFASSNTAEFVNRPGSALHQDIAEEFAAVGIDYARSLEETAFRLGLMQR